MIDMKTALSVKHEDSGSFDDYSSKASQFERDAFTFTLDSSTGYLYVGYRKPINSVYFNCKTEGYTESSITLEYYNGAAWTQLDHSDDTLGFMRPGFVKWSRPEDHSSNDVDGETQYWYRLSVSDTRVDLEFKGINLVFSDDYELSLEDSFVTTQRGLGGKDSHILTHTAVRNEILQKFNKVDYYKLNSSGYKEDINAWDLHDITEVKLAAAYLALSKIYQNMTDDPDGFEEHKSKNYYKQFEKFINIARLSLDVNDDGKKQPSENKPRFKVQRLSR